MVASQRAKWARRVATLTITLATLQASCYSCFGQADARLPKPQVLIKGWQHLHDRLSSSVHGYRLDGTSRRLAADGSSSQDKVSAPSWHAINSKGEFTWWFTDTLGLHQITSRDGEYDAYSESSSKDSFLSHNTGKKFPIDRFLEYYLSLQVPFRLETLIDYPTAVLTPEAMKSRVPFEQVYAKMLPKLTTVGSEMVGHWRCFHVRMSPKEEPKGMLLPTDIWFAVVGNEFIPVQFYICGNGEDFRNVITVTKLRLIEDVNVPVSYRTSMDLPETLPSGKQDWGAHPVPRYTEYNLNISQVNASFPPDAFQIVPSPTKNRMEFENDKLIKRVPAQPRQSRARGAIMITCLLAIVAGFVLIVLTRRRARA